MQRNLVKCFKVRWILLKQFSVNEFNHAMASGEVTKVFFIFVFLQDAENTHFYSFELVKTGNAPENIKTFGLQLKPCVYKKRWSHVMKTLVFWDVLQLGATVCSCIFYVNVLCLLQFKAYSLSQIKLNYLLYLYMFSIDIQVHDGFLSLCLDENDLWNNPVRCFVGMITDIGHQFGDFSSFFL